MNVRHSAGKVVTVLGEIDPDGLGVTLPHEHLMVYTRCYAVEPQDATTAAMVHHPLTMDILWWVRQHPFQNLDDIAFNDEQLSIKEVLRFKYAGGDSIVELTLPDIGRDPLALARISRATGLNVIMGCGYYVQASMGKEMDSKSEEEIVEEIVRDATEGTVVRDVGVPKDTPDSACNTMIRSGIIGEIGCSWPMSKNEAKTLRAAIRAQQITGAALNIHPGHHEDAPDEIIRMVEEAGGNLTRTVMDHIDRTVRSPEHRKQLAKTGCYMEYDMFGQEGYFNRPHGRAIDLPNDHQRINEIADLAEAGYLNQILISHDMFTKSQCCTYGGFGFDHILRAVVPVMRQKGFFNEDIRMIMVENPKRLLTIA